MGKKFNSFTFTQHYQFADASKMYKNAIMMLTVVATLYGVEKSNPF